LVGGDETEYFGDVYHLNWVVGTHWGLIVLPHYY
jgi:hypothetical protein